MKQLNILVIDDNHDLADGLGMILEDEGHQVSLAYNGEDAIKIFNDGSFDRVFIDVKLPDMSGIEVFQAIHHKNSEVNVFMMTGYRVEQLIAEVVDNGSVQILRKPMEIESVGEALKLINQQGIMLIADDTPGCADQVSAYLSERDITNKIGHNAKETIEHMLANPVEVLVLDLHKPIIYALEVYLELKQKNQALKTIIVTGCTDDGPETSDILRSTSITGCLFKPFDPEYMLQIVEQELSC